MACIQKSRKLKEKELVMSGQKYIQVQMVQGYICSALDERGHVDNYGEG